MRKQAAVTPLLLEEAERVTVGIEQNPDAGLRLKVGQHRTGFDGVCLGRLEVGDPDIEVNRHLLVSWAGGPHRTDVVVLLLKGQSWPTLGRA